MKDNKNTIKNDIILIKSQMAKTIANQGRIVHRHVPPQRFIKACNYMASNGKLVGNNIDTSLHDFFTAIIRQSSMILGNYGVIIKQNEVFPHYKLTMDNKEELHEQVQMSIFYTAYVINMFSKKYDHVDKPVSINHIKIKTTWNNIINYLVTEQITYPYMPKISFEHFGKWIIRIQDETD